MLNFLNIPLEEQITLLCKHFPSGLFWNSKWNADTVLGKLIIVFAKQFEVLQSFYEVVKRQETPLLAKENLTRWETFLGIPDENFKNDFSIDLRLKQAFLKMFDFQGAQTKEDFIRIGKFLGETVEIEIIDPDEIKVVLATPHDPNTFPLDIPFEFTASLNRIFEGLFLYLTPANVKVTFQYKETTNKQTKT